MLRLCTEVMLTEGPEFMPKRVRPSLPARNESVLQATHTHSGAWDGIGLRLSNSAWRLRTSQRWAGAA